MLRLLSLFFHLVRAGFRSNVELAAENVALRQQLAVLKTRRPLPRLSSMGRVFWIILLRLGPKWTGTLIIVERTGVASFEVVTDSYIFSSGRSYLKRFT
jgi:hypothetical protein